MFFTKDGQTLYLSSYNYNAARVMNRAAALIVAKGGEIEKGYHHDGYIVNRSLLEMERKAAENLTRAEKLYSANHANKNAENYADNLREELQRLRAVDNSPRAARYTTYFRFTLGGEGHYLQIDENPFFDSYYTRKKGNRNTATVINPKWQIDPLFSPFCTDSDIEEAAHILLSFLPEFKAPTVTQ